MVTNAVGNSANTLVQGVFNSRANETYELDFFSNQERDGSSNGEGAFWIGTGSVTTDASGNAVFSFTLPRRITGRWITATATDSFGNTSEFSPAHRASSTIPPQTFTVTTTDDSGPGSLRQALLDHNASAPGLRNIIQFNIPGSGVRTIVLSSPLPPLTEPAVIDGFSQPGSTANAQAVGDNATRLIRISGESLPSVPASPLLRVGSSNVIRGLILVDSPGEGLRLDGDANVVSGNLIGLEPDGTRRGNAFGVYVNGTGNRVGGGVPAERNIISANDVGVTIFSSSNSVLGNYIGTDATGRLPRGNVLQGVYVRMDANVVGGTNAGEGNVIAGSQVGIDTFRPKQTRVLGNYIGTDVTGLVALRNGSGIVLREGVSNQIGGAVSGSGNLISGNQRYGIHLEFRETATVIQGNIIGADISGAGALRNLTGIYIENGNSNLIGGTVPLAGNFIAFNSQGIQLLQGTNNSFLGNSIFAHTGKGISLGTPQAEVIDALDADNGANKLQKRSRIDSCDFQRRPDDRALPAHHRDEPDDRQQWPAGDDHRSSGNPGARRDHCRDRHRP